MKTQKSRFKTLFLCTGNSARSILAEYLLRKAGKGRFEVFSAGVNPKGTPHPIALAILRDNFQIDTSDARSKSVDEFKDVEFDFVITVCDNAREACPVWPGRPIVAHWSSPIRQKLREMKAQLARRSGRLRSRSIGAWNCWWHCRSRSLTRFAWRLKRKQLGNDLSKGDGQLVALTSQQIHYSCARVTVT
jgi:protein-tyrosine-phosphatase